jgi:hypothetical protein
MLITKEIKMKNIKNSFWVKHREFLSLPLAFVVWYYVPRLTRLIDPQAGQYDASWIEAVVLATVALLAGSALIWVILRWFFPEVYRVFDDYLETNHITTWQKGLFSLWYFFGYLIAWSILVMAFL